MNNNHHQKNGSCRHSAEVVEFIYGDLRGEQKTNFETHFSKCAECADEIKAFSGIHFAISDWKKAEFDNLPTPVIEIPYEYSTVSTQNAGENFSFFDAVRRFINLSPMWAGAVSVIVLAFLTGLGLFIFNQNQNADVAGVNKNEIKKEVSPTGNAAVNKNSEKQMPVENVPETADLKEEKDSIQTAEKDSERSVPVRISENENSAPDRQKVVVETKNPPLNDKKKTTPDVPRKTVPRLNELPEETEDDSLRLSDMFEEIDTRD